MPSGSEYSHKSSINKIEHSKCDLSRAKLESFAKVFGVELYTLLGDAASPLGNADIARELEAARKKNKLVIMDFAGDGQDIIEISDEDASLIRQLVKSLTAAKRHGIKYCCFYRRVLRKLR
ncbi:MAG: hypothetical protein ACLUFV_08860 [Acutalibacteraceae bacterium]